MVNSRHPSSPYSGLRPTNPKSHSDWTTKRVPLNPAAPPVLGALSEITGEGLDVGGIFADALRLGIG